jgi:hypothetical protein
VHITRADFSDPRLAAFLQAHLDDMEPTAPPESRHALDLTALQATAYASGWAGQARGSSARSRWRRSTRGTRS